jgi:mRNA-degrading endonuclease RelE of RelBE toxin-antitoxin system
MKWKILFSRTASKDFSDLNEPNKTLITVEIKSL